MPFPAACSQKQRAAAYNRAHRQETDQSTSSTRSCRPRMIGACRCASWRGRSPSNAAARRRWLRCSTWSRATINPRPILLILMGTRPGRAAPSLRRRGRQPRSGSESSRSCACSTVRPSRRKPPSREALASYPTALKMRARAEAQRPPFCRIEIGCSGGWRIATQGLPSLIELI